MRSSGSPSPEYRSPKRHGAECEQAAKWLASPFVVDGVHVYVDDVDAHFRQAKAAGATILEEPTDQPYGDRRYTAEDPEGHRWAFATHIKEARS